MTDYADVITYIKQADREDLYDIAEKARNTIELRNNEDRIRLLRVSSDGLTVAHFREDEMRAALEYCLKHVDELYGQARIETVKIIESEVGDLLRDKWW